MSRGLLVLLALTAISIKVQAQGTCEIRGKQNNLAKCFYEECSTSDRTRYVRFSDGREIWVVGHNHGDRSLPRKLLEFISKSPTNEANLNRFVEEALRENSTAATQYGEDSAFLERFLRTRNNLSFVGVETYDSNLAPFFGWLHTTREVLGRNQVSSATKAKVERLLQAIYGPQIYMFSTQPQLFVNSYLKGFEDEAKGDLEGQIDAKRQQAYERLKSDLKDDPKFLDLLIQFRTALILANENYDPSVDDAKILEAIQDFPNARRPAIFNWVKLELAALKARLSRDETTATRMAREGRSGILFVGHKHLNALARVLQAECRKEQAWAVNRPPFRLNPSPQITR